MTEQNTAIGASDARRRRKRIIVGVTSTLVVILAATAVTAAVLLNQPQSNPAAQVPPTPTVTSAPEKTPTPSVPPTPDRPAQPTDCRAVWPLGYPEGYEGDVLNDPSVVDGDISRFQPIEHIRETLPGIECHWGLGTEGGVMNAVNTVDPAVQIEAITVMEENDHVCEAYLGGTVCRQSETYDADEYGTVWTAAEEHFFRDNLWVSTWFAGVSSSIKHYADQEYATIWK